MIYCEMDGDTGEVTEFKGEKSFNNFSIEHPSSERVEITGDDRTIILTTFYSSGNKKMEEGLTHQQGKNVVKNGLTTVFYEDGSVYIETNYRNGKFHGEVRVWNEDGELVQIEQYENGDITDGRVREDVERIKLIQS